MTKNKARGGQAEREVYRLVLLLPRDIIYHLKARAASERISVSALVTEWVQSWKDVKRK